MNVNKLIRRDRKKQLQLLFEQYGNQLYSYASRQWKIEPDVAWDLVYDSIYKVIDKLPDCSFEVEAQLKSFLFKTFINKMKNRIRDDKTKQKGVREIELNEESYKTSSSDNEKEINPKVKLLNEMLDELEDWQRILMLMRAQGFSYTEIAKYVNKSEKNLKVYYGRLRKRLAEKIELQLKKTHNHEQ